MSIFFLKPSPVEVNAHCKGTLVEHMGIEITKICEEQLEGQMRVTSQLKQPYGILHGGANCVLAETLGSLAANLTLDAKKQHAVGLSILTNHTKAVRTGVVSAVAKPIHIGEKTQVWDIKSYNEAKQLTSSSQLTMAIINKLTSFTKV